MEECTGEGTVKTVWYWHCGTVRNYAIVTLQFEISLKNDKLLTKCLITLYCGFQFSYSLLLTRRKGWSKLFGLLPLHLWLDFLQTANGHKTKKQVNNNHILVNSYFSPLQLPTPPCHLPLASPHFLPTESLPNISLELQGTYHLHTVSECQKLMCQGTKYFSSPGKISHKTQTIHTCCIHCS